MILSACDMHYLSLESATLRHFEVPLCLIWFALTDRGVVPVAETQLAVLVVAPHKELCVLSCLR
jgi:hypothetical protein